MNILRTYGKMKRIELKLDQYQVVVLLIIARGLGKCYWTKSPLNLDFDKKKIALEQIKQSQSDMFYHFRNVGTQVGIT